MYHFGYVSSPKLYHVNEQNTPTWVKVFRQAAIKQRGLSYSCQLNILVCFTRLTKRGTTLNHPHPVETMTGPCTTIHSI